MRTFIFEFEQEMAIENGLNCCDMLLISYFHNFFVSGNAVSIRVENDFYFKITRKKILSDLPILGIKERQLVRILQNLEQKNILKIFHDEQNRMFIKLNYDILACQKCHAEKVEGVINDTLSVSKMSRYNSILNNNNININISVDKETLKNLDKQKTETEILNEIKNCVSSISYSLFLCDLKIKEILEDKICFLTSHAQTIVENNVLFEALRHSVLKIVMGG